MVNDKKDMILVQIRASGEMLHLGQKPYSKYEKKEIEIVSFKEKYQDGFRYVETTFANGQITNFYDVDVITYMPLKQFTLNKMRKISSCYTGKPL